jgi:hypothetical protein
MPLLVHVDQSTGLPVRKPKPVRYELAQPGQLVHVDIKKQRRIPNRLRVAHPRSRVRARPEGRGRKNPRQESRSCRLARLPLPPPNARRPPQGSGNAFFAGIGVNVTAVMTDNGACYRSHAFAAALGDIKHKWTRPYGPHTNGKVERFHRTLAAEWAYAATYDSDDARAATYQNWLHHYNHHRPHRHRPPDSPRSQPTREVGLAVQIAFLVAAKHPRS